jgi:hypothetical protein
VQRVVNDSERALSWMLLDRDCCAARKVGGKSEG